MLFLSEKLAGCFWVWLVTSRILAGRSEIYTSIEQLTAAFTLERRVVDALSRYLYKTEATLERIRRYLREYEQVQAEGDFSGDDDQEFLIQRLAGNPIHAFHLVKRLTVDWKYIGEHNPQSDWKDVEKAILDLEFEGDLTLPDEDDLRGAAQALVRLQSVYQLNTSSLVRGNVLGLQSAAELGAQDCLFMGKHSFNMGMYYNAIQWFEEAYTLSASEENSSLSPRHVVKFLSAAIEAFELTESEDSFNATREVPKTSFAPTTPSAVWTDKLEKRASKYTIGVHCSNEDDFINFEALCRGEHLLSEGYISTLTCFYDRRNSSYLTLMPAKVEVHHHKPQLIVFHDVIDDDEIGLLRTLAKPQLSRALVQGVEGRGNTVSSTRTSKVAWVNEGSRLKELERIARRIADLTSLKTDLSDGSAELLQIANYGTGGHYNPHHDYLLADKSETELRNNIDPRELEMGDRIATFMFYLTNVNRGGATVFPKLGVSLWPQKGSAAFWFNLKKSGEGDKLTLHGACPVVHGSKWVSNKWIRERNQFLLRPCGLSPSD